MNPTPETAKNTVAAPLPDLSQLIIALGHPNRWKILKELTCGETRTVSELAAVAGCGYDNAAKHLAQLYRAGMVVRARGRVYQLAPHHLPAPGQPVVDFGHCLLRLDAVTTAKLG